MGRKHKEAVDCLPEDERRLGIRKVADYFDVSPSTIRRRVKEGEFPQPDEFGGQHRWMLKQILEYNRSLSGAKITKPGPAA